MRTFCVLTLGLLLLISPAVGQGWVGQGIVNRPDSGSSDMDPCIATDNNGYPWVVWDGFGPGYTEAYTRWLGNRWDDERGVGPNAPGVICKGRPSLAASDDGRFWLVWCNDYRNNTDDIGSSFWLDTCWAQEIQVNQPDSTELDFAPDVACGGGEVWCVWYGGPNDCTPYSVYASRWNPAIGAWDPEMQVSPQDSNWDWWCHLAVDSLGTPHVVWCNSNLRLIYYSFYDGVRWVPAKALNDTAQIGAPAWADPHIAIDRTGVLHVSFTGVARGATGRDIFYTRNEGRGWTPPVRVTQDTIYNYNEWYSDIAADRPDNVWVVWDRQDEGLGFRVYASHYDGKEWSAEQRVDNDTTSYYDGVPAICLDSSGCPWVVWRGIPYGVNQSMDIYYNRYTLLGLAECPEHIKITPRLFCYRDGTW